jgi:hypothetical protein
MKKVIGLVMVWFVCFFALIGVKGQTATNGYKLSELQSLPIGQGEDAIKDWILKNGSGTEVSQQLMYHDKTDTNAWGGSFPWSYPMQLDKYATFEYFMMTNGMHFVDIFKTFVDTDSDIYMNAIISTYLYGVSYWPVVIHVDLGPLNTITTNSFENLPLADETILIPIAGLKSFSLRCGEKGERPTRFWYTYSNGISKSSFGSQNDYCVTPDGKAIILNKSYPVISTNRWYVAEPTERVRATIVADDDTVVFTQHGGRMSPPQIIPSRDVVRILTTTGSDIEVSSSTDGVNWVKVASKSWSENTGALEFPVDHSCTMQLFKVDKCE